MILAAYFTLRGHDTFIDFVRCLFLVGKEPVNRLSVWGRKMEGKGWREPFRFPLSPVPRSTKGLFTG